MFETFTELHYSQTGKTTLLDDIEFETFTELHYSQTLLCMVSTLKQFETFTELHYSQTPNTSPEFQSLSSHHQV